MTDLMLFLRLSIREQKEIGYVLRKKMCKNVYKDNFSEIISIIFLMTHLNMYTSNFVCKYVREHD